MLTAQQRGSCVQNMGQAGLWPKHWCAAGVQKVHQGMRPAMGG